MLWLLFLGSHISSFVSVSSQVTFVLAQQEYGLGLICIVVVLNRVACATQLYYPSWPLALPTLYQNAFCPKGKKFCSNQQKVCVQFANVSVKFAKCIWLICKMYLINLPNVFVQFSKCQWGDRFWPLFFFKPTGLLVYGLNQ